MKHGTIGVSLLALLLGACGGFRPPAINAVPADTGGTTKEVGTDAPLFVGFGMSRDPALDRRFAGDGPLEDLYYVSLRLHPAFDQQLLQKDNTPGISAWVREQFDSEARHAGVDIDLRVDDVEIPTQPIFLLEYDTDAQVWRSDLNGAIQTPWVLVKADTEIRYSTQFTWSKSSQNSIAQDVTNTVMSLAGLSTGTWLVSEIAKTYLQKTTGEVNKIMNAVTESSGKTLVSGKLVPARDKLRSFTYAFSDLDRTPIGTVRFEVLRRRSLKSADPVGELRPRSEALPTAIGGTSLLEDMQVKGENTQPLLDTLKADGLLRDLFNPDTDAADIYRHCQEAMGVLATRYGLNQADRLMVMHQLSRRHGVPSSRYERCFADHRTELQAMGLEAPRPPQSNTRFVDLDADKDGDGSSDAMAKFGSALKAFDKAKGFQLEYERLLSSPVFLQYEAGAPHPAAAGQADFQELPPMRALRHLSRMNVATFCCYRNVVDAQGNEIKDRSEAAYFRPIGSTELYRIEFLQYEAGAPVSRILVAPVAEGELLASQRERLRQRADTDHPRRNEDIE